MIYVVAPVAFVLGVFADMAYSENMILAYWLVIAIYTALHIVAVSKYAK